METTLDALDRHADELDWDDAVAFWRDGSLQCESYASLGLRAQRIARALQQVASPGDRAVLIFPAGLEFVATFYACLYAGIIAVPAAPPRGKLGQQLLTGIVQDCRPALIITPGDVTIPGGPRCLSFAELDGEHDTLRRTLVRADDPAVLQYTSGSTGDPRGVIVSHRNLVANSRAIASAFRNGRDTRVVMWLPHYHDMGLVGGIVHPVVEGFRVTLLCPWKFIQKPSRWLRAVSDRRATRSGGPNFAFAECARRIGDEECEGLDLSSWDLAFVGAEPIRLPVLERFATRFERLGFRRTAFFACYGLAEATLFVTGGPKGEPPRAVTIAGQAESAVDCGVPAPLHDVAVVDPSTGRPVDGQEGEVWITGPSVTRGYWNAPEGEQRRFLATLEGDERTYYRTGDCGVLVEGRLAITGRLKDLVIVRGVNYHPGDIEHSLAMADERLFGCVAAAFSVQGPETEELVVMQELDEDAQSPELSERLRQHVLRTHGILPKEIVLVKPRSLPRTSSGKVRRAECRSLYLREGQRTHVDATHGL